MMPHGKGNIEGWEVMANHDFYEAIFANFWRDIDRTCLVEDSNSMFADAETFSWLIKTVQPKEIIEIGSWKGHSANYAIDECRKTGLDSRIVCVDTFMGGPEHWLLPGSIETLHRKNGQPTILNRFLGNTVARQNIDRVFPLCLDSTAASYVFNHFAFKADLIFVYAAHDYDAVVHDIMNYYPLLARGGVMFGDDYQFKPLADAVHDCARKLGFEVLVHARKWVLMNEAFLRKCTLPDIQLRKSFDGWIHP